MTVDGCSIECVKKYWYLGSIIAADCRIDVDVDKRLSKDFKACALSIAV